MAEKAIDFRCIVMVFGIVNFMANIIAKRAETPRMVTVAECEGWVLIDNYLDSYFSEWVSGKIKIKICLRLFISVWYFYVCLVVKQN